MRPEERTRFIEHQGVQILYMDFTNVRDTDDALAAIEAARQIVAAQPPASVRTLVHVTGSHFNSTITNAMKAFAAHNKPYVIASCVVGATGLMKVIIGAVRTFTRRVINTFDTVDEARNWLAAQT